MRKECIVKFKNGKMIVNNSKGIYASQIQNFYVIPIETGRRRVEIIYLDSNNKFVRAGISFNGRGGQVMNPKFEQFMKRLIKFMNEGK